MTDTFDTHLAQWQAWAEAPWGRLRFALVEEIVRRQTDALGPRLRVLDVGGGDGRDAIPLALAGHDVTVVDTSAGMLAEASRRAAEAGASLATVAGSVDDLTAFERFDLVLCHFVLHYRPADAGDVARLAACVRPGGRLSVIAPNPVGRVYQVLTRSGPAAALAELESADWSSSTFDHTARKITAEEMALELEAAGLRVCGLYGGRTANDVLTDDELKHDPDYLADLVRLEIALCDREPYRRIGGFWQLVAERPA